MLAAYQLSVLQAGGNWSSSLPDIRAAAGQTVCILGPSDTGKTRLAMALAGLRSRDTRGHIEFAGRPLNALTELERARIFGYVPTDPRLLFSGVRKFLSGEFTMGRQFLADTSQECSRRIEAAIHTFELEELLHRDPFSFSGGEVTRAAIALVAAKGPKVLVLDQVFDMLDPDWSRELRKRIRQVLDSDAVIIETHAVPPEWGREFDGCLQLASSSCAASELSPVETAETCCRADEPIPSSSFRKNDRAKTVSEAWALKAEGIKYDYGPGAFHLGPIDITLARGECVALVGPNGSGKTTLLKCLALLNEPRYGKLMVRDPGGAMRSPPNRKLIHEWARSVMYVFQNPDDQLYLATVRAELEQTAARSHGRVPDYRAVAGQLGIENDLDLSSLDLPQPKRRLVTIASALAACPPVLLLDEPTAFLDLRQRQNVKHALNSYLASGGTACLITHDPEFARAIADRAVRVSDLNLNRPILRA